MNGYRGKIYYKALTYNNIKFDKQGNHKPFKSLKLKNLGIDLAPKFKEA